ncbi:50S ribosomal protein L3 [Candidatus Woesearchaeota archaeon]|nr:50S ribosomal protein L3 [Candidatus Woesearchaeota archaeon]
MPTKRSPRRGTMQFWPRKRSKRQYARVRHWPHSDNTKPLGFSGYKVGMAHVSFTDNRPNSLTKGNDIIWPITIIECPPLKIASLVFYKKFTNGLRAVSQVVAEKLDKDLARKIPLPKKSKNKLGDIKLGDFDDLKLLVFTQPKLTGIGKKKPELFELAVGGKKEDKLKFAHEKLGKEIYLKDALSEGDLLDARGITKGKGIQGPVKRFGVAIRAHKSEKTVRGPGSLGGWGNNRSWTVAHAGQTGFHQRTEYNKWLLKIGDDPAKINTPAGFRRYGKVKNPYILVKGSVLGPSKRLIIFANAVRPDPKISKEVPAIAKVY